MANRYDLDPHCVAIYRFESGALTVDSKDGNTLTVDQTPVADTVNYQEGAASVDLELDDKDCLWRADTDLSSNFPMKNGSDNYTMSITCWIRVEAWPGQTMRICSKRDGYWGVKGWDLTPGSATSGAYFTVDVDPVGVLALAWPSYMTPGNWYFIAVTVTVTGGFLVGTMHIWDLANDQPLGSDPDVNGTASGEGLPCLSNRPFVIGAQRAEGYQTGFLWFFDGNIDELTVWDKVLTAAEITEIREGLFPSSLPSTPTVYFWPSSTGETVSATLAPFPAVLPVAETLEWLTGIAKGADGSEQRIAHRGGIPRQGFIYPLFCETEAQGVRLAAMIHKWLKRQWFVPVWPEAEPITISLALGAMTIPVDTRYADYRADSRAVIYQDPDHAEIMRVATVADDALTLSSGLAAAYEGTLWIAPCRLGYVTAPASSQRYSGGGSIVDMTFEITDNIAITGHVPALEYDGLEVLTEPAKYFGDSWRDSHEGDAMRVDAAIGGMKIVSVSDFNITIQDHGWVNDSKAKAWSFRQWLHAVVGRQKSFLVPTLRPDFTLTRTCQPADTSIYVANRGFASNMGVNAMATYLAFRPAGATIIPRKITGMATISTSEERIDLDLAPAVAFAPGKELCWLHQCRLASDRVKLDWYERGENTCEMQLARVSG